MQMTKRTHLQARFQNTLFMVLLLTVIGLIAWLSTHYEIKADWTINNRHSLSEASRKILVELKEPIKVTAYITDNNGLRLPIQELVERYQRQADNISLHFVDPFYAPDEVRQQNIQEKGEILIQYKERTEQLRFLSEQELTSALQRLLRPARLAVFLTGHSERSPTHFADHDLSQLAVALKNSGINVQTLNFGETPAIPDETNVLVIASARQKLLPAEVTKIADYIDKGGNLLWLMDPSIPLQNLEVIAEKFGLTIQPGIIVDPISQLLGVKSSAVVSITRTGYGEHPVTSGFEEALTLFPHASGLIVEPPEDDAWEEIALLTTNQEAWSETDVKEGAIEFDEETDIDGPLDIAFALERDKPHWIDDSEDGVEDDDSEDEVEDDDSKDVLKDDDSKDVLKDDDSKDVVKDGDSEDVVKNDDSKDVVKNGDSEDVVKNDDSKDVVKNGDSEDVVKNDDSKDVVKDDDSKDVVKDDDSKDVVKDGDSEDVVKDDDSKDVVKDGDSEDVVKDGDSENVVKDGEVKDDDSENIEDVKDNAKTELHNHEDGIDDLEDDIHDDIHEQQRVIIVGEGDFLSNAFLGYGGNLELSLKMMNWLAQDDTFIEIPSKTAVDLDLELSSTAVLLIGGFFLFILPLGLISTGISIWLQRRKA
ncbi:GldG family protein [Candidatus Marithioploca araucensis]|uniref:GldG family protein n=1 Tax=Candidatus Marithioploca araucensis TaxID=70273 RepID=A0ABT7VS75_9GAMM|nr:GldG family protein [Candidatus Marithioploca araucensis]